MFPGIDPSQLDPKLIAEISELMATLPPAQIMKMQTLMHNAMAGIDVRKEMADFERDLPAGFREKMAQISYRAHGVALSPEPESPAQVLPGSVDDARLTILEAVAAGGLAPRDALRALFPA